MSQALVPMMIMLVGMAAVLVALAARANQGAIASIPAPERCPVCGKGGLRQGRLSGRYSVGFLPLKGMRGLSRTLMVAAFACGSCGHLALGVDQDRLRTLAQD